MRWEAGRFLQNGMPEFGVIDGGEWSSRRKNGDRYGISREVQDEYSLQSQLRIAAAQQAGKFDDEIVPLTSTKIVTDRETGETHEESVTLTQDEGNRPTTTLEGLAGLKPVVSEDGFITAGFAASIRPASRG